MKKNVIILAFALAAAVAACKKRAPENIPQPKTGAEEAAVVSTGAVKADGALAAPGAYLKNTVGHVSEAKAARALFEKTARQGLESLDLNKAGGN